MVENWSCFQALFHIISESEWDFFEFEDQLFAQLHIFEFFISVKNLDSVSLI